MTFYEQVAEVSAPAGKVRLSLTGWFHGPLPALITEAYAAKEALLEQRGGIRALYGPDPPPLAPSQIQVCFTFLELHCAQTFYLLKLYLLYYYYTFY